LCILDRLGVRSNDLVSLFSRMAIELERVFHDFLK
jgi:hypothetical protein